MATTVMHPASITQVPSGGTGGKRYRIERTLGEGTYGKVKLAYDNYTREKVAIKIIRKENVKTKKDMERVRREIDILSVLRHPHIIKVIDVVETRTNIIIVMEYAVNGELFDYINERRFLDESESRKYFRQIVSAVDYCHKNLIVHRDLKLENLLLDKDMNIKIIDFGLSNQFTHDSLLSTFCGSPLYASPEMIQGKEYQGPEVDCWSLGVVLYTLLCGTMPFDDSDMKHLVECITSASYPTPRGLTKSAQDVLCRLLRANPKKRATIENIRTHPWINDGYSKPPLQQPLSNIAQKDRRRLSSKISCLSETPLRGLTPRTRSTSRTPSASSLRSKKSSSSATPDRSEEAVKNAKRKLVLEPTSPRSPNSSMKPVEEEVHPERPKSASAMLSKPSKPPRPSKSRVETMISGEEYHERSKSDVTPASTKDLVKSSSYDNKDSPQGTPEPKMLTPDRRTLSENISLAKFATTNYAAEPPKIKDAGAITMVDSEAALFDGFGGSTRCIQSVSNSISELTQSLADMAVPEEAGGAPAVVAPTATPTPVSDDRMTPTNPPPPAAAAPAPKKKVESRLSTPRTPLRENTAARSKAAINKSGLGAKRPLNRPAAPATTQRAKSMATRERPTSVKTRTPGTTPVPGSTRSRRSSDVVSVSNLSVRSEADISRGSTTRGSLRKPATAPAPAKRNLNVKSKVDCHRTPRTTSVDSKSAASLDKEKKGVRSQISSLVNKKSTAARKQQQSETTAASAPTTPRSQRSKTAPAPPEDNLGEMPTTPSRLPRYRGSSISSSNTTPHRSRSNTEPGRPALDMHKQPFR